MSAPWRKPLDVDRLSDGGADVDFAVPLAELQGLRSPHGGVTGEARGRARFCREQGIAVVELTLTGVATLTCQRCMQPMEYPFESRTRVALVASEAQSGELPADLEPVLAAGGRISLSELITQELLLLLPIVPRHAGDGPCAGTPAGALPQRAGSETQRPFAHLAELLKR
jgi:uncharacterized protein